MEPPKPQRVSEDGWWGQETTLALQQIFGCAIQDGIVSRQPKSNAKYLANASPSSWEFRGWPLYFGGSAVVKALQAEIGADVDGYFGRGSVGMLQVYSHEGDVIIDLYTHDSKSYRLSNLDGVVKLEQMNIKNAA